MKINSYLDQNILVIGLGVSGRSAANYLISRGAAVTGIDKNQATLLQNSEIQKLISNGLVIKNEQDPLDINTFSLVVASPGISCMHPIYRSAKEAGIELIGEIELACREIKVPFIGVTGTNGKTTVSYLLGHIFNTLGKKTKVLGNSGIPLTSLGLMEEIALIVCELSSYQLETLNQKIIDCAVILNITPDHLDRYPSMQEYAKAKLNISKCLKNKDALFVGEKTVKEYFPLFAGIKYQTFGFHPGCDIFCDTNTIILKEDIELFLPDEYRGKSNHDVENIMAAFALCNHMGIGPANFNQALASFKKPPHRIELVKTIRNVNFYNDSKGTNLDAVIRAVESMPGKVILIAGGVDKGAPFTPWITAFGEKVKIIVAIGEAKEKLKRELSGMCPVILSESLEIAIKQASALAEEGDSVLLSPGCASFDMFKNFEQRGDRFKEVVHALEIGEAK